MKFTALTSTTLDDKVLEQDYQKADKTGWLMIGQQCVYYKGVLKVSYLPISDIVWAYMRQEDNRTKMCCGKMIIESFFLVITTKEKQQKMTNLPNKQEVKRLLAVLEERNPNIDIGYSKEKAEKYL